MAPKQKSNRMCSKDVCASYKNDIENPSNVVFTPTLTKNLMSVKFGKRQEKCLLDTGADISAISKSLLDQVAPEAKIKRSSLISIRGVCGEIHQVLGEAELNFECDSLQFTHTFQVFQHLHTKMLVGLDFLRKNNVQVRFGGIEVPGSNTISAAIIKIPTEEVLDKSFGYALTVEEVIVPPHSELIIPVKTRLGLNHSLLLLEPKINLGNTKGLAGGKCVSKFESSRGVYRLMNPTSTSVFLSKNFQIAKCSLIHDSSISALQETTETSINNLNSTAEPQPDYKKIINELGINVESDNLVQSRRNSYITFLAAIGTYLQKTWQSWEKQTCIPISLTQKMPNQSVLHHTDRLPKCVKNWTDSWKT